MQRHLDAYGPMVGRKYGRLTVTAIVRREEHLQCGLRNIAYCQCDCECGVKGILVNAQSLKRGATRSCGCLRNEVNAARHAAKLKRQQAARVGRPRTLEWMLGQRFGRLTVTMVLPHYRQENSGSWRTYCRCDCGCGTTGIVLPSNSLNSGLTRSCGCLRREMDKRRRKHHPNERREANEPTGTPRAGHQAHGNAADSAQEVHGNADGRRD